MTEVIDIKQSLYIYTYKCFSAISFTSSNSSYTSTINQFVDKVTKDENQNYTLC